MGGVDSECQRKQGERDFGFKFGEGVRNMERSKIEVEGSEGGKEGVRE